MADSIKKVIAECMEEIVNAYPGNTYGNNLRDTAEAWYKYFKEVPPAEFRRAFLMAVRTSRFAPTPGVVYQMIIEERLMNCPRNEIWNAYRAYAEKISELKDQLKYSGTASLRAREALQEEFSKAPTLFTRYTGRITSRTIPETYKDDYMKFLDTYLSYIDLDVFDEDIKKIKEIKL